jgi:hypothetical protein
MEVKWDAVKVKLDHIVARSLYLLSWDSLLSIILLIYIFYYIIFIVTTPTESNGPVPPVTETIEWAAAEITRLYRVFDKAAALLTDKYYKARLAGKEGVTWAMFPRSGFHQRPVPILDSIMRQGEEILLGAGYNMWHELLADHRLAKTSTLLPQKGDMSILARADTITIRRSRRGYDPGIEYAIIGNKILQAGMDHYDSMPTTGSDGKLAWSVPRSWVNGTFRELVAVTPELQRTISHLQRYEPVVTPTV